MPPTKSRRQAFVVGFRGLAADVEELYLAALPRLRRHDAHEVIPLQREPLERREDVPVAQELRDNAVEGDIVG